MKEFSESVNVNLPPMKDISYVIEVLLKGKLDNEKLHQIPSDDKTVEDQKKNLPSNEYIEASLQLDEPPKKTISYGSDDLLED